MLNDEVIQIKESVESISPEFLEMVDKTVTSYTKDLDDLVDDIKKAFRIDSGISDEDLEYYSLELSTALYILGGRLEKTGILEDIAKALRQETYNKEFLDQQQKSKVNELKMTVQQLQAIAEEHSKYNTVMQSVYSRVYKQIKFKIDAAFELLGTLKKIISKRISDSSSDNVRGTSSN